MTIRSAPVLNIPIGRPMLPNRVPKMTEPMSQEHSRQSMLVLRILGLRTCAFLIVLLSAVFSFMVGEYRMWQHTNALKRVGVVHCYRPTTELDIVSGTRRDKIAFYYRCWLGLRTVSSVHIFGGHFDDDLAKQLGTYHPLKHVVFEDCNDNDLRMLATCRTITCLTIVNGSISDTAPLKQMRRLERIDFVNCKFGSFRSVSGLTQVTRISFIGSQTFEDPTSTARLTRDYIQHQLKQCRVEAVPLRSRFWHE